jgi:aminoglycoside phosphotransferase (APT) family kinase protein
VAAPLHLCRDESVIGSMFYLMEYVDGRIHWDPSLPALESAARRALPRDHRHPGGAARHRRGRGGLADYGKPGNYFARQLSRWSEQYQPAARRTSRRWTR